MATTTWQSLWSAVWPFGSIKENEPLAADKSQLVRGEAYVDPSRLFGGKLSIPYNPSVLATRKGLNVFDQMKMDEQVKSALLFKKHAVLASGWEVVSPGDQDEKWEVTAFVRDALTAIPGGMVQALRAMMLGIDYGYSITEKVYGDGVGALEGKMTLSRLISVKPHYFDFAADAHGMLLALLQKYVPGQTAGAQYLEFAPDKFIIYTHEKEFENWYGRSDLESAYRAWWIKDNTYKWFAVMLERYGMAPLFVFYNPNTYQDTQVGELKKVVRNIQNATLGLIPRGAKDDLELWSADLAGSSKDVFLAAMARFDADIAKALLQPSLTGFSGESGGSSGGQTQGSLARSNIHWKAFIYVVEELQTKIAVAVNEQLVHQLCDLNFAGLKSYPLFKFQRLDDETQLQLFDTWQKLVAGNVVNKIADDEKHIRDSLGFPENDDAEVLPAPAAPAGGEPGGQGKPVSPEQQTKQMQEFAEANGGEWRVVAGDVVCVAVEAE